MQGLVCDFCSSGQRFARGLVGFPHPASFRFHLAMDTLAFLPRKRSERLGKTDSGGNKVTVGGEAVAFGYILPTTGRIRDFHPLERALAGRTNKKSCRINVVFVNATALDDSQASVKSVLFQFNNCSNFFKLCLEAFCFCLFAFFLDVGRCSVYQCLSFLKS